MSKLNSLLDTLCPCSSNKPYASCCEPYLESSDTPPTAEALMRSRYTAYTFAREDYLLETWHASTRPKKLGFAEEVTSKWIGLQVKHHQQLDATHAIVEFVARSKVNGRAFRLHEVSNFVREDGRWFYVDGES